MDAEISAMATISEALEKLDADARSRVLQWAAAKYVIILPSNRVVTEQPIEENNATFQNNANGGGEVHYDTIADLYADASPNKDPEKVLVAGYWHQLVKGEKELTSVVLNKELANLGHRIKNINRVFTALISSKPQLALQLRKSGSAKQARKKYKLTQAGIAKVQGMLAN